VVLTAEQVAKLDWQDRDLVRAIATKVHGERGAR
jgi:hypothetical protein